ncbi:MAG: hypothetical protein JSS02_30500, partial [Planctomycetes bacterium]|nr:hypothetical protein [Planctomycetota bacterium]
LKVPFEQSQAEYIRDIHKSLESIRSHSSQLAQAEADVETHASPKKHAQMRGLGMAGNTTGRAGTRGAAGGRGATTGRGTGAAGSNNGKAVIRDENEGERKIREAVLANAQKQVDSLNEKIEAEQQTMEDLRQQRREAPQKFREESLSQRQALRRARYRESELSARAQAAARGQWTAETIRSQVKSLETYVPLHLDVEQTRLLQSVKYKPPQH